MILGGNDMSAWLLKGFFACLLFATVACAQSQSTCPLSTAKNGEMVNLEGEAIHGAHDGLLRLAGCKDEVVLAYADDPSLSQPKLNSRKDEMFKRFRELFNAEQDVQPNSVCKECWKYRVTAKFEGRLDITESAGWKKNSKTGKIEGIVGYGHPIPFTRYRLVVVSVTKVEAVEMAVSSIPEK
jgi:hypothetical protein